MSTVAITCGGCAVTCCRAPFYGHYFVLSHVYDELYSKRRMIMRHSRRLTICYPIELRGHCRTKVLRDTSYAATALPLVHATPVTMISLPEPQIVYSRRFA